MCVLQYLVLIILALNAWAARAQFTIAHPIATLFPWYGCPDDLATEHSFNSQRTWPIGVLDSIL